MRIERLRIKNFSSHEDSTLEFNRQIALIVGELGAGKSSIQQAAEYALCGETGYYRKRGDPRRELVRNGAGIMEIDLETSAGRARRVRNAEENTETAEWNGMSFASPAQMDAAVSGTTGVSKTLLSCLFNVSDFFFKSVEEQKEIIMRIIGAEVSESRIKAQWKGDVAALDHLRPPLSNVRELDAAYDFVFKLRTAKKRELDALTPPRPPEGKRPPLAELRARLKGYEDRLLELASERGKLEGQASVANANARVEAEIAQLKQTIDQYTAPDMETLEREHAETVSAQEEAATAFKEVEHELVEVRAQILGARENIRLLEKFNGRCVAGDHACPAPASDMKKALGEQTKKLKTLENVTSVEITVRLKNVQALRDDRKAIQALERTINSEKSEIARHAEDQRRMIELLKKRALVAPVIDEQAMTKIQVEEADLRERIGKGKGIIEDALDWQKREQDVARVADQRRVLETTVRHLNELCEFLGKDGVRVQLIDEQIGKFIAEIQQHLTVMGFEIEIDVNEWRVVVNGQPLARLSESERYRVSVAFQIGIAKMSGLNFIVCDRAELLTPPAFSSLVQTIIASGLEQAILVKSLMVPNKDFRTQVPKHPAIETFLIAREKDGPSVVENLTV